MNLNIETTAVPIKKCYESYTSVNSAKMVKKYTNMIIGFFFLTVIDENVWNKI